MPYQDTWRDGQTVSHGERNCDLRYRLLEPKLAEIPWLFEILDIGANAGYFSIRAVDEFNCLATAVDDSPEIKKMDEPSIITVPHRVDAKWLLNYPRVDVVFALSVLHHMKDWRKIIPAIQACRVGAIVEIPDPQEDWMRSAAARHELRAIDRSIRNLSGSLLGTTPRTGRNNITYQRPMFFIPGTVHQVTGTVFSGSGTNSRKMPAFSKGLDSELGYQPFPGSLNVKLSEKVTFGKPLVDWVGRNGSRTRDYQMWRAWVHGIACHAMIPGTRGHGDDCLEIIAPMKLRDTLFLTDGEEVIIDVDTRITA